MVKRGPVFSEITVTHPFAEKGRISTCIRLFAGLRRIEIRTKILNNDRFVRYRALFPTTIEQGKIVREIPFGAVECPDGIEMPAQNWIDYGDGKQGFALLNRGIPGSNVADGVVMLSLMRSTEIVAYGIGGGYEGQGSSSGFEVGKENTFDYALVPHAQDWVQARISQEGMSFNHPLMARSAAPHVGTLPGGWHFLDVSNPNVLVSAMKLSEDGEGAVLRVYESAGEDVKGCAFHFTAGLAAVEEIVTVGAVAS